MDAIKAGGVYHMASQSEGFPDAQAPRAPSRVCVMDTIKEGGANYMVSQGEGFPDVQAPRRQPRVCV